MTSCISPDVAYPDDGRQGWDEWDGLSLAGATGSEWLAGVGDNQPWLTDGTSQGSVDFACEDVSLASSRGRSSRVTLANRPFIALLDRERVAHQHWSGGILAGRCPIV